MVESPPANAGDVGSSPGPGGSHMPHSNWAHGTQLLSLCSRAHEPWLLKPARLDPVLCSRRGPRDERHAHCNED